MQADDTSSSEKHNNNDTNNNANNSTTEEEEFDISTPTWFYQDSNQVKQGPFSFKEMFLWWKSGYFAADMLAKTVWEGEYRPISSISEFSNAPAQVIEKIEREQEELYRKGHFETYYPSSTSTGPNDEEDQSAANEEEYQVGTLNPATGKYETEEMPRTNIKLMPKNGHVDRDARMMAHYFDFDQYQNQMRDATGAKKQKKLVKGSKKFWKERKEKKKRAKLVAEYLAD